MKFINYIKSHWVEIVFILIVLFFLYMYFVAYMTPSKLNWYDEMENQIKKVIYGLINKGRWT